jgi:hypothetical protein
VPQSQCGGLEAGPAATTTAGAACFFPACYLSPPGNDDDEEYGVAIFAGRDEGAGYLIVLEGEYTGDLFPNTV